jgi:hypothetical protein
MKLILELSDKNSEKNTKEENNELISKPISAFDIFINIIINIKIFLKYASMPLESLEDVSMFLYSKVKLLEDYCIY